MDTLEDSLIESKEVVASMTPIQETLTKELLEERNQMKLMMAQNTKLMSMLETNISGKRCEAGSKFPGDGKVRRQKCTCKHCEKDGYHDDDACFSLPQNKDKRPYWYNEYKGMGFWDSHVKVTRELIASDRLKKKKEESLYHYHHNNYSNPLTSQAEALDTHFKKNAQ